MSELDTWAAKMRAEGLSEASITERVRAIGRCATFTGADPLQLTEADIVAWLGSPTLSPGSRQKYFGSARAWSLYLLRAGIRQDDPTEWLKSPRVPRRQPRPVADEGFEAVLASRIHKRTRVMIHLMAYQGLRRHEVAKFSGDDIDRLARTVSVVGKGGVAAINPLHPVIAADAETMPRHGWWFPSYRDPAEHVRAQSVGEVVAKAMRRAGVDATGHQLRHWYGTTLLGSGVDVRIVQELMRHASLNTTALYTKVHLDQQRDGLSKLRPVAERRRIESEAEEAA